MTVVTMHQLLKSGVYFRHRTRRWDPKMKRFILTDRFGIYILDLQQTLTDIDNAFDFVKQTVAHGSTMLFAGTKKQAQESIQEQATRMGMPYVNQRWLSGILTNFTTVHKRLQCLRELEQYDFGDTASAGFTKKELLMMRREKDKLAKTLGGIHDMNKTLPMLWVVDTKRKHLAISEAQKPGIPVVAILDTNCNPDEVDYGIPGNDDAARVMDLLTKIIADACAEGLAEQSKEQAGEGGQNAEPMAEWERDLLQGEATQTPVEAPNEAANPEVTHGIPAE